MISLTCVETTELTNLQQLWSLPRSKESVLEVKKNHVTLKTFELAAKPLFDRYTNNRYAWMFSFLTVSFKCENHIVSFEICPQWQQYAGAMSGHLVQSGN